MAVVPAQAGMSPSRAMEQRGCSRSPRAGGDEPALLVPIMNPRM